jgi:hypothetical protein
MKKIKKTFNISNAIKKKIFSFLSVEDILDIKIKSGINVDLFLNFNKDHMIIFNRLINEKVFYHKTIAFCILKNNNMELSINRNNSADNGILKHYKRLRDEFTKKKKSTLTSGNENQEILGNICRQYSTTHLRTQYKIENNRPFFRKFSPKKKESCTTPLNIKNVFVMLGCFECMSYKMEIYEYIIFLDCYFNRIKISGDDIDHNRIVDIFKILKHGRINKRYYIILNNLLNSLPEIYIESFCEVIHNSDLFHIVNSKESFCVQYVRKFSYHVFKRCIANNEYMRQISL